MCDYEVITMKSLGSVALAVGVSLGGLLIPAVVILAVSLSAVFFIKRYRRRPASSQTPVTPFITDTPVALVTPVTPVAPIIPVVPAPVKKQASSAKVSKPPPARSKVTVKPKPEKPAKPPKKNIKDAKPPDKLAKKLEEELSQPNQYFLNFVW